MSAVFQFCEDDGSAIGNPPRGTLRTSGVSEFGWKNIDSAAASYTKYPIVAGTNSFDKFIFGVWSGTFNSISNVRFQHVSGVLNPAIFQINVFSSGSGFYSTPSNQLNTNLTKDLTNIGSIGTGILIRVGAGNDPQSANKVPSAAGPIVCSEYIGSQLVVGALAPSIDSSVVFQIQWNET